MAARVFLSEVMNNMDRRDAKQQKWKHHSVKNLNNRELVQSRKN